MHEQDDGEDVKQEPGAEDIPAKRQKKRAKNADLPSDALTDTYRWRKNFVQTVFVLAGCWPTAWKMDGPNAMRAYAQIWKEVFGKDVVDETVITPEVLRVVSISVVLAL